MDTVVNKATCQTVSRPAGIARVPELKAAGVDVGLGVDGSASNERSDMFFEVKQALLFARARCGPEAMTVRDALRHGTRGGAAVLGRDDIGRIAPGCAADIIAFDLNAIGYAGHASPCISIG